MQRTDLAEAHKQYCASSATDAGAAHLSHEPHGRQGEVYACPRHVGASCELCGGSGYRAVCNLTACHEYGCQQGTCGRIESDSTPPSPHGSHEP